MDFTTFSRVPSGPDDVLGQVCCEGFELKLTLDYVVDDVIGVLIATDALCRLACHEMTGRVIASILTTHREFYAAL